MNSKFHDILSQGLIYLGAGTWTLLFFFGGGSWIVFFFYSSGGGGGVVLYHGEGWGGGGGGTTAVLACRLSPTISRGENNYFDHMLDMVGRGLKLFAKYSSKKRSIFVHPEVEELACRW